jgi:hypothetical protein
MGTAQNEVRLHVRLNALDLGEFTVEELQQVTGLNVTSIRTELMRMKEAGFLTSKPIAMVHKGRGAPPHLYRLTTEPEKLALLNAEVQRFSRTPAKASPTPQGLNYARAEHLLAQLEASYFVPIQRDALTSKIHQHLELAREDLGIAIYADAQTEVPAAYLEVLWARLALANEQLKEAEHYLRNACAIFERHEMTDAIQQCQTLLNAIPIARITLATTKRVTLAQALIDVLNNCTGNLPVFIVRRIVDVLGATTLPYHTEPQLATYPDALFAGDLGLAEGMPEPTMPSGATIARGLSNDDADTLIELAARARGAAQTPIDQSTRSVLVKSELMQQEHVWLTTEGAEERHDVLSLIEFSAVVNTRRERGTEIDPHASFLAEQLQLSSTQ